MNTPREKKLNMNDKSKADPITLEVVRNALVAIVMEMTDNLIRTAYSPIAAEIKDFSIGLLDANGDSIAQAPNGVPMFCADLNATIKKGLEIYAEEGFEDGDIILSNDTETNGQHVNNMAAYSPIIANGEVVAFAAVRSHWIDVGGQAVGSMPGNSRDIYSEGIQIPFMKVYRGGKPDESVLRLIKTNSRFPELVMGDMRAQISGTSRLMSWSTRHFGPTQPAADEKTGRSVSAYDTSAALRSWIGGRALNGPLVKAPSEPAPVVDGDLPVRLAMKSMNASGSS